MKHLDEGTIHAWLDGALDAAQSREVDAHVAQCQMCSAAVAEARGLVAASSRILTALDDVPGGVLPKRGSAPPKPARRQWRAAPWVSAIAATLVIAVGVATLTRDRTVYEAAFQPAVADSAKVAAEEPQAVTQIAKPEAATPVAARQDAPQARTRSVVAAVAKEQVDSGRETTLRRPTDLAAADRAGAAAELRRRQLAESPAAGAGGAPTAAAVADVADQRNEKTTKSAAAPTPAPSIPTSRMDLEKVAVTSAPEVTRLRSPEQAATIRFAGCYRLPSAEGAAQSFGVAQKAARAVASSAGARDSRASAAAAADYVAPLREGDIIRLDTLRQSLGYLARNARSEESIGNWRTVGADSARIDLLAAGLFKVALKDKVNCPER